MSRLSQSMSHLSQASGRVYASVARIEMRGKNVVTIVVHNFASMSESIRTEAFVIRSGHSRSKWFVRVDAARDGEDGKDGFVGLHLHCLPPDQHEPPSKFCIDLEFRLIDEMGSKHVYGTQSTCNRYIRFDESQGWNKFCRLPRISSESKLMVECHLLIHAQEPLSHPLRHNSYPIEDDSFDFSVVVGGQAFPVHQRVLADASPVFSAMFSHDVSEVHEKRVVIRDVDPDAVRKWIEFMYSGSCFRVAPHAEDLLYIADRYDVKELFLFAQEHLAREISKESCLQFLCLADDMECEVLMEECLKAFVEFGDDLMKTTQWDEIVATKPKLTTRTVSYLWTAFRDNKRPCSFPPCCSNSKS